MSGFALHLMRHGAPETPGLLMGRTDGTPTEEGIAACIAQQRGLKISAIIASDLRRALAPAEAIGTQRNLSPLVDPRWRELDFGAWEGMTVAAVDQNAMARFWADPDKAPPPGGERWSTLVDRVAQAIDGLIPVPTLVVTHGGAMRAALAALCGLTPAQSWAFALPYSALLSLHIWPGERPTAQITGLSHCES
ncbi:MAG: histidine phosphatase family protein [Sphingobium sp.]